MYRHMKHACKKNKEDELKDEVKELVRLLRQEREDLKKQIEHLSEKLEHNLKV